MAVTPVGGVHGLAVMMAGTDLTFSMTAVADDAAVVCLVEDASDEFPCGGVDSTVTGFVAVNARMQMRHSTGVPALIAAPKLKVDAQCGQVNCVVGTAIPCDRKSEVRDQRTCDL
jgi:hypothetical protein